MGSGKACETDWDAVFGVLVEELGVSETLRAPFVQQHAAEPYPEWRIGGILGFGGKLYDDGPLRPLRVGTYAEDATPGMLAAIERTNARLAAMAEGADA